MTAEEWEPIYRRLIRGGPGRTISAEQMIEYFSELRDLSAAAVSAAASRCIREIRYFPACSEIREFALAAMRGGVGKVERSYCGLCGGTGWRPVEPTAEALEAAREAMAAGLVRSSERKPAPERLTLEAARALLLDRERRGEWRPRPVEHVARCECRRGGAAATAEEPAAQRGLRI